jgi:hypothetical protein
MATLRVGTVLVQGFDANYIKNITRHASIGWETSVYFGFHPLHGVAFECRN